MSQPRWNWTREEAAVVKAALATEPGRRLLDLIITGLGGIGADSFSSDPLVMAHIAGRRFVARELDAAVSLSIDDLVKEPHEPRSHRPITATERARRAAIERPGRD